MEYINKTIGKYIITSKIGEGGMASVYEAVHERLGTKVAVKILSPVLARNPQLRQRFENEANFMASLNHPNITRVLDIEEQDDTLAIVMELLEGEDLDDRVKRTGPLSENEAKVIFIQVLNAFEYAHSKGIVHRDIKPSNIFIDKNDQVKILDFGIAKIFGTGNEMTQTGTQMGTPVYMSPEQVKGDKSIDHRSDIYSLGITLYFLLVGKAPYESAEESSFEIFTKIVNDPIPNLPNQPFFDAIIQKAVEKDRNNRFQEINEFKNSLETIDSQGNTSKKDDDKTIYEEPLKVEVSEEKLPEIKKKGSTKKILLYSVVGIIALFLGIFIFDDTPKTPIPIEWVDIPEGTFTMGSPKSESDRYDNETQHKVTLSAFKMSKNEITFKQYDAFCDATGRKKPKDEGWGRGERPVINVSWNDATAFANWMGCRLPTEAEWEYACRAGSVYTFTQGTNLSTDQANYNGNYPYNNFPKGNFIQKTMPVASYPSNSLGLNDMHGNVFEWCSDWYGDYSSSVQTNPTGASSGSYRVLRGGSWYSNAQFCRSAGRFNNEPSDRFNNLGFRLVVAP
jgi:sulfatase modifying factor 1